VFTFPPTSHPIKTTHSIFTMEAASKPLSFFTEKNCCVFMSSHENTNAFSHRSFASPSGWNMVRSQSDVGFDSKAFVNQRAQDPFLTTSQWHIIRIGLAPVKVLSTYLATSKQAEPEVEVGNRAMTCPLEVCMTSTNLPTSIVENVNAQRLQFFLLYYQVCSESRRQVKS
jgi:hypothetical protein